MAQSKKDSIRNILVKAGAIIASTASNNVATSYRNATKEDSMKAAIAARKNELRHTSKSTK